MIYKSYNCPNAIYQLYISIIHKCLLKSVVFSFHSRYENKRIDFAVTVAVLKLRYIFVKIQFQSHTYYWNANLVEETQKHALCLHS